MELCSWTFSGGQEHFYDVYQRLTLLPDLLDRAAFVFRFTDDPPYLLRQYDLPVLYGLKDINQIKTWSNEIDSRKHISGDLVFYSENYKGKCKISFSYSEDEQKISISLRNKKTRDYKGYRRMRVNEERSNLEVKK